MLKTQPRDHDGAFKAEATFVYRNLLYTGFLFFSWRCSTTLPVYAGIAINVVLRVQDDSNQLGRRTGVCNTDGAKL